MRDTSTFDYGSCKEVIELVGIARAFVNSQSMKHLAEEVPDFEWWFGVLAKKVAEIDAQK
jgi:hypothetical protein